MNLLEKGIRVNAVAPGPVWTPLNPADEGLPPEKVAQFGSKNPSWPSIRTRPGPNTCISDPIAPFGCGRFCVRSVSAKSDTLLVRPGCAGAGSSPIPDCVVADYWLLSFGNDVVMVRIRAFVTFCV